MWNAIKAEKYQLALLISVVVIAIIIFTNTYTLNSHWKTIQADFNQSKSNYDFLNATNQEIVELNNDHAAILKDHNIIQHNLTGISIGEQQIIKILQDINNTVSSIESKSK